MFQQLRKRMTPSTVIAIVALVFAATGGAFAATGGGSGPSHATLTATAAKSKSKAKAGPRGSAGAKGATGATGSAGPAGPTGPAGGTGPQGPQGNAGTNGTNGENGKEGTPGAPGVNGKSVVTGAASSGECKAGGTKFEVEGSKHSEHVCNGEGGSGGGEPQLPKTLPSKATETGAWSIQVPAEFFEESFAFTSLSFPIPLEGPLNGPHVFFIAMGEAGKQDAAECPGTLLEPTAAPGDLCIYTAFDNKLKLFRIVQPGTAEEAGAGTSGARLELELEAAKLGSAYGTWAVTAE